MSHRLRGSSLIAAMFLLAACGTTVPAGTGSTPTQGGGGGGTTPPAATDGTQPTQVGGGGGGFTGAPCSLLTTDEAAGVLGGTGWTAQDFPLVEGAGQCIYTAGTSVAAISITTGENVETLWGIYSSQAGDVENVSGVGEKAIFMRSTESMFFVKNGTLIGITAGTGADGYDKRLALSTALGKIIAGRL